MDNDDEPVGRDQGKQKKILLLLAPLFVILLVIQGPTLLSLVTGSDDAESTSEESASADDSASADAAGAPAESALGPDTAIAATAAQPVFVVVDSDLPPRADQSELTLLTRFEHRDPFIPGVDGTVGGDAADESDEGSSAEDADAAAAAAAELDALEGDTGDDSASGDGDSAGNDGDGADEDLMEPESGTDPDDDGGIAEARLQVNGSSSIVRVGSAFPSFDPVFRLESLAGDAVRIGLVRGSYSTGSDLVDIEPGETRTLISQPDGTRYRIRLVGVVS